MTDRERDERGLVEALRRGDERAFSTLLERHHAALVRVAGMYVADRATAEEVAQDTWLAVLQGIDRFEGRSSLKTWIFHILANLARTRAQRDRRQVPLSSLGGDDEPEVDPDRFLGPEHPERPGAWAAPPRAWPEERLLARETVARLRAAIEVLPPAQRAVIGLRDVEGWSAEEVCQALDLTPGNQRVLLHRARARVRAGLEEYLGAA